MHLEIISRRPDHEPRAEQLLFVHGAYCGAWIWDEHFLPYFARCGYAAHAVSLRGHGGSDGYLPRVRLADYVDDIARAVDLLPEPPVLVGHSLGGVAVQLYLRRRAAPAAVLLAPGPPQGMLVAGLAMWLRKPAWCGQLWLAQALGVQGPASRVWRRAAVAAAMPRREVDELLDRMQGESWLAAMDLLWPFKPATAGDTPVLVLGAEEDCFISPGLVRATAGAYGTEAEIFPRMGHAMMVDKGWQQVADRILQWLVDSR